MGGFGKSAVRGVVLGVVAGLVAPLVMVATSLAAPVPAPAPTVDDPTTLTITVVDADGLPVEGIDVSARHGWLSATTGADGMVTFAEDDGLRVGGSYLFDAYDPDLFEPYASAYAVVAPGVNSLQMEAGVFAPSSLVVQVVDPDLQPLDGVYVYVNGDEQTNYFSTGAATDENGLVSFQAPPGVYDVTVDVVGGVTETGVVVTGDADPEPVVIVQEPPSTGSIEVSIRVSGVAEPDLYVQLSGEFGNYGAYADLGGSVTFSDVYAGEYQMFVYDQSFDFLGLRTIAVVEGANEPLAIDLTFGSIEVVVRNSTGTSPIAGVPIDVQDDDGYTYRDGETDADGRIVFDDLPTGDYTVRNWDLDIVRSVSVETGATTVVEIDEAIGGLDVTVLDGIDPVMFAQVSVTGSNGAFYTSTDDDGSARLFPLRSGGYTLTVRDPDTYALIAVQQVTVGDGTIDPVVVAIDVVDVFGITVLEDGLPVVGADVGLGEYFWATTDGNGLAQFADVPSGTYVVEVYSGGYSLLARRTIEVSSSTPSTTIVIERGSLDVTVVDQLGSIPQFQVSVGDNFYESGNDGVASFADLPTGEWELTIRDNQYGVVASREIVIEAGAATEDFEIETRGVLVTVMSASEPVADAEVGLGWGYGSTDAAGQLVIERVPVGQRDVYAAAPLGGGYVYETVVIPSGGADLYPLALETELEPGGSVTFEVTDGDGQPLEGVTATLDYWVSRTTGVDGLATFGYVPAGEYAYEVTDSNGRQYGNGVVTVTAGSSQTITIMAAFADAQVTVFDGDAVLPDVDVELGGQYGHTDENGVARFTEVVVGAERVLKVYSPSWGRRDRRGARERAARPSRQRVRGQRHVPAHTFGGCARGRRRRRRAGAATGCARLCRPAERGHRW